MKVAIVDVTEAAGTEYGTWWYGRPSVSRPRLADFFTTEH